MINFLKKLFGIQLTEQIGTIQDQPEPKPQKQYELYWQEIHIGTLTETNWDMRSAGYISYSSDFLFESDQHPMIIDYIRHSIKMSNSLEEGDEENHAKLCEAELKYLDLIHSEDWYLVNQKGEREKILIPIFPDQDEIVWQLDYKKGN